MGLAFYEGGGRYVLNSEALAPVLSRAEALNGGELRVDDFLPDVLARASRDDAFLRKALKILDKLGATVSGRLELRDRLLRTEPPGGSPFVGDRLLVPKSSYAQELRGLASSKALGESSGYHLSNYLAGGCVPLTVAYVASCALVAAFDELGDLVESRARKKPSVRKFSGQEPFGEDEPLYELSVEYPELLMLGRKMASRLLKEYYRFRNCAEVLEEEEGLAIAVTRGSLLPHGFVLARECDVLRRLMRSVREAFDEAVKRSSEKGVVLVGISKSPRDYRFFGAVKELLGLRMPPMSDYAFLHSVMRDGDATAPMSLPRERGRVVENWYEFYVRRGPYLYKLEYVTDRDPVEVQREILTLLYPAFLVGGSLPMVAEAERYCRTYLARIKQRFESALRAALRCLPEEPMGVRKLEG